MDAITAAKEMDFYALSEALSLESDNAAYSFLFSDLNAVPMGLTFALEGGLDTYKPDRSGATLMDFAIARSDHSLFLEVAGDAPTTDAVDVFYGAAISKHNYGFIRFINERFGPPTNKEVMTSYLKKVTGHDVGDPILHIFYIGAKNNAPDLMDLAVSLDVDLDGEITLGNGSYWDGVATPLIMTCSMHPTSLPYFISANAKLNVTDPFGNTPLHVLGQASNYNQTVTTDLMIGLIDTFVKAGCDINGENKERRKALFFVIGQGPDAGREMAAAYVRLGADLSAVVDYSGTTFEGHIIDTWGVDEYARISSIAIDHMLNKGSQDVAVAVEEQTTRRKRRGVTL